MFFSSFHSFIYHFIYVARLLNVNKLRETNKGCKCTHAKNSNSNILGEKWRQLWNLKSHGVRTLGSKENVIGRFSDPKGSSSATGCDLDCFRLAFVQSKLFTVTSPFSPGKCEGDSRLRQNTLHPACESPVASSDTCKQVMTIKVVFPTTRRRTLQYTHSWVTPDNILREIPVR